LHRGKYGGNDKVTHIFSFFFEDNIAEVELSNEEKSCRNYTRFIGERYGKNLLFFFSIFLLCLQVQKKCVILHIRIKESSDIHGPWTRRD